MVDLQSRLWQIQKKASEVASRFGITATTLYAYVNGDGSVKEPGQRLLDSSIG